MIHISYRYVWQYAIIQFNHIQAFMKQEEDPWLMRSTVIRLDMVDIAIVNLTPSKLNKLKYMEYTFSLQIVPLCLEVHFLSCQKETFHMYLYKCCLSKFPFVKNILYAYANIYNIYIYVYSVLHITARGPTFLAAKFLGGRDKTAPICTICSGLIQQLLRVQIVPWKSGSVSWAFDIL